MRREWMIAMMLALASNSGLAQQTTPSADSIPPSEQPVKEKINPPQVIHVSEAHFSEEARQKGINGKCIVLLTIDATGLPRNPRILSCTDPSFEETSLVAASQYQFKPATTQEGNPVPFKLIVEIDYHLYGTNDPVTAIRHPELQIRNPVLPLHYRISSPPGTISTDPTPDGIYPLTKFDTPPTLIQFPDQKYRDLGLISGADGDCDVVITISTKGKASDPQVTHCKTPALEKPLVQILLNSRFKPGKVNGKVVPMRVSIYIEYGGSEAGQ